MAPLQAAAGAAAASCTAWPTGVPEHSLAREICALYEWLAIVRLRHERPPFGIHAVQAECQQVAVIEEVVPGTPFGSLFAF